MRLQKYGTATHFLLVMVQDLMRVPGRKRALTLTCCLTWDDTAGQKKRHYYSLPVGDATIYDGETTANRGLSLTSCW
jgi:hypothetical protein